MRSACSSWTLTIGCLLTLLTISRSATAQDLLRIFAPGDPQYQLIGGNPFSVKSQFPDSDPGSSTFVRFDGRADNYYSEERKDGTSPSLGSQTHSLALHLPFRSNSFFDLSARSTRLSSQARNSSDQVMDYQNSLKLVRLSYDMPLYQSVRWNLALGHSNATTALFQDIATSVSFRVPAGALSLQVDRSSNSQDMRVSVAGAQGLLPLDHRIFSVRIGLAVGTPDSRIILNGYQTMVSPLPGTLNRDRLRFEPAGSIRGWESRFETSITSSWRGMLALEILSFGGGGTFKFNGSRYGLVNNVEYKDVSASAGVMTSGPSGSLFLADVKWMEVAGSFAGHAETWPFVSGLQSLISQRGNFQIAGSFRLTQIHAGALLPAASWLRFGGGITALRLIPALRIESWQTGFLGTGRKAYADRRLSVDRLDGMLLSGGVRLHAGTVRFDYSISQFVPIALEKKRLVEGATDLFVAPEAGMVVGSWGGLFQRLSVQMEID